MGYGPILMQCMLSLFSLQKLREVLGTKCQGRGAKHLDNAELAKQLNIASVAKPGKTNRGKPHEAQTNVLSATARLDQPGRVDS